MLVAVLSDTVLIAAISAFVTVAGFAVTIINARLKKIDNTCDKTLSNSNSALRLQLVAVLALSHWKVERTTGTEHIKAVAAALEANKMLAEHDAQQAKLEAMPK